MECAAAEEAGEEIMKAVAGEFGVVQLFCGSRVRSGGPAAPTGRPGREATRSLIIRDQLFWDQCNSEDTICE